MQLQFIYYKFLNLPEFQSGLPSRTQTSPEMAFNTELETMIFLPEDYLFLFFSKIKNIFHPAAARVLELPVEGMLIPVCQGLNTPLCYSIAKAAASHLNNFVAASANTA